MIVHKKRLGDLLVESGLITEELLLQSLKEKGEMQKLGDALIEKGYLTEQQLIEVLEFQLGIPHISLYRYPIDEQAVSIVPREFARRNFLIPIKKDGDKLLVAMADPMDFMIIEDLRLTTGFQIERAIAAKDDILRAQNKYYEVDDSIQEFLEFLPQGSSLNDDSRITEENSPIVKLVNQIIQQGIQQKASDIHFDPQETKLVVRYRIDGMLKTERSLPKHMQNMLTARIKIMANLNITENRLPQDGRIKINLDMHPVDLRISTLPAIYGEKIVLRILDLGSTLNNLDHLGFNKLNLQRFSKLIKQPNGIILITGPTGSGKSSTLYSTLNKLNHEEVNIVTIEDPVEYQLAGINQIQVNSAVGLTFASGLRSILRQDPDIVMVGEIRDTETAEIAVRASLTGHLVLSTIHTNDSIGTIARLTDMGVEPFLVAASLSGVVAQRLVRKVCRDCKQTFHATEREKEIFSKRGISIDVVNRGKGCGTCNMTGYKGRLAVHEVLVVDEHIRKLIMNNRPIIELRDYAMKNGTIFLIDDGLLKVKKGLTTTEEVLRVAISE
ncbi:Flp pilus assembly complex ATPase component TadA [Fictibacillus nanhaiensis]|uniref:GspE/PulE family protein n=1 Tax=Fictibacillus nanhaiensis TaxID=742169 RepID=UPI001C9789D9|nr:type II/IV secretion system protein [Fictibacillus nanhaiensis]MBY6037047.1 Flp pilus assembly complex ATPase component TadA [Fictibacillus nanhaiensis]